MIPRDLHVEPFLFSGFFFFRLFYSCVLFKVSPIPQSVLHVPSHSCLRIPGCPSLSLPRKSKQPPQTTHALQHQLCSLLGAVAAGAGKLQIVRRLPPKHTHARFEYDTTHTSLAPPHSSFPGETQ